MLNKYKNLGLVIVVTAGIFSSCSSYKKVPYLEQPEALRESNFPVYIKNMTVKYQPEDILSITVNSSREPAIASAFNLPVQPSATTYDGTTENLSQGLGRQTYLVNSAGEIDFPVLGTIRVAGMNRSELEAYLKKELKQYIKEDPVITIRLMNYRVSVLGEVTRPGQYSVSRDKINVLEALSLAGDMTIYGKRDNVTLMRETPDGEIKVVRLDLNSTEVLSSPYFYLQQNDVIYVEPNKAKAKSSDIGTQTTVMISIGSLLLGIVNLVILLTK
ncbi:MAG: polysaccharide biosynthesis/export family protein [Dysgonamonadaceae bacterium]|jgi:polysaccharide export outer membrane protein|nr:polysaccharide biosynthesis/export family protein [Dysgonamonadaceae bacterium]